MHDPVDVPVIDVGSTPEDRQWALFAHLGGLIGAAVGVGSAGFVVPLVIWLIKKDQSRFVEDQAKEALNFHITLLLVASALAVVGGIITLVTFGLGFFLLLPAGFALWVYGIAMPIVAAMKSNAGELYRYPLTLRLIK